MGALPRRDSLGGLFVGAGSLLWAVKSVAIMVTGEQPRMLFELAPACFAAGVLLLALGLPRESWPTRGGRRPGIALGVVATAAGTLGAAAEVGGNGMTSGIVLGVSVACATAAAVVCARPWPWRRKAGVGAPTLALRRAAWGTGLALPPAYVLMLLLAPVDDHLIEVGLLVIAAAWAWLAVRMLQAAR